MKLITDPDAELPTELQTKVAELQKLFNTDAVIEHINALKEQTATTPFAPRFSKTRLAFAGIEPPLNLNPLLKGTTEEAYKRGQILINLEGLQGQFMTLYGKAREIMLDLEMAQMH